MDLTDAQWAVLEPTFRPRRRPDGRGRPWTDRACRAERRAVGPAHRRAVARPAAALSAVPNLPSSLSAVAALAAGSIGSCNASPRISATAAKSISVKPSSTRPSPRRKKGRCGRSNAPRQRHQDHGDLSTVMVFLSPCTWPALHRMSRTSSPPPSTPASSPTSRARLIGDRGYDSDPLDDAAPRRATASR